MLRLLGFANKLLSKIPHALVLLVLRIALAVPFFKSGLTRWDGFGLSSGTVFVFTEEFKLHIFGGVYPYPFPLVFAWGAAVCEILLPIMLVLGLGTRFAAFGLLCMTAMIQLTYPDAWSTFHLPWAAMALTLTAYGGGRWALDRFVPEVGNRRRDRARARRSKQWE